MANAKNNGKNMLFVSMKNVPKVLMNFLMADKPIAIEGPPGCGKSSVVELTGMQYAKKLGYKSENIKINPTVEDWKNADNFCIQIILGSQMDALDTKGGICNDRENGLTLYLNTALFPTNNWAKAKGILFFDELGNTRGDVQSALQPMFVNRKVNNIPLADVRIIAATNSIEDNTGVNNMNMALCNRFAWIETGYLPSKEWVELMVDLNKPLHPTVAAYLTIAGEKMVTFDADSNHKAYATPRSWENASIVIQRNNFSELKEIVNTVGMFCGVNEAEHFETFVKISMTVDIDAILKDPKKIKDVNSNEPGLLYSVLFNLIDRTKTNSKNLPNVLKAIGFNEYEEYNILALKMLLAQGNLNTIANEVGKIPELKSQMGSFMNIIKDAQSM